MARFRHIFALIILCCVFQLCQLQFLPSIFGGIGGGAGGSSNSLSGFVNGIQSGINRLFGQSGGGLSFSQSNGGPSFSQSSGGPSFSQQQQYNPISSGGHGQSHQHQQYFAQPLSIQPSYMQNGFHQPINIERYPSQQPNFIYSQQRPEIGNQQSFIRPQQPNFIRPQQPSFINVQQPNYIQTRQPSFVNVQPSNFIDTQQPNFINAQPPKFIEPQQPSFINSQSPVFTNTQQPSFVNVQRPSFVNSQSPVFSSPEQPSFINSQSPTFTDFQEPSFISSQQPAFTIPKQPSQLFTSKPQKVTTFTKPEPEKRKPVQNYDFEQIFNSKPTINANQNDYNSCGRGKQTVSLIVHGNRATKGDWPWLVAVYKKNKISTGNIQNTFKCGSTLLSEKIVVTAAHCVTRPNLLPDLTETLLLRLGAFNLDDEADETVVSRGVSLIKVHEDYNAEKKNDIAMLVMSQIVKLNYYIRPICLWPYDDSQNSIDGQQGTVVGWGKDETGSVAAEPRTVKVPILSVQRCRNAGKKYFPVTSEKTFCAGARDGSGPCNGDSGGGLFLKYNDKWYLRGLVSLSVTQTVTCDLNNYVIYTDVAKYDNWIRERLK